MQASSLQAPEVRARSRPGSWKKGHRPAGPSAGTAPSAAETKASTLPASFASPSGPHTPLDTSTPPGRVAATEAATLPGCRPPASSQPRAAPAGGARCDACPLDV